MLVVTWSCGEAAGALGPEPYGCGSNPRGPFLLAMWRGPAGEGWSERARRGSAAVFASAPLGHQWGKRCRALRGANARSASPLSAVAYNRNF